MNIFTLQKRLLFFTLFLSFTGLHAQNFTDIPQLDGISINHDGDLIPMAEDQMPVGTGAGWFDFNNDGLLDLYVTMRTGANLLFENLGYDPVTDDYIFDEVAVVKGVDDAAHDGSGVTFVDYNNDGNIDIFLSNCDQDVLLRNSGPPQYNFSDVTAFTADLNNTHDSRATSASWGDYDGDGYLDLYISHHVPIVGSSGNATARDFLFHNNNGSNTFTDVSHLLGLNDLVGYGFIGGWTDYDKDGDMDLILINDCDLASGNPDVHTHTRIFKNNSHLSTQWNNWNFTEVSESIGVDDCRNGMGIAVGDFNRDGWMDFFYTNIGACVLFQNDGDGTFTDVSTSAGIDGQDSTLYSWGCAFADVDLDGYQDLMVAFGSLHESSGTEPHPNQLFRNNGNNTFTNIAGNSGVNMDDPTRNRSAIYGDYDNDGDLDIFLMSYGEECIIKRNEHINDPNTGNNWLQVKLEGDPAEGSNRDAVGARLKLTYGTNDEIQYFEIRSGSNLGGGDDIRAYFGLGSESTISELEITWPSGNIQTENNIAINQLLNISELSPLPVQLVDFTANPIDNQVLLEWSTYSELNNDYFTIQRSADGSDYKDIGRVSGNGTSTEKNNYHFFDEAPLAGNNYYRLRQTDFDGTISFSKIKTVRFETIYTEVQVRPNPVTKDGFKLSYEGSEDRLTFELFDIFGKIVKSGIIQQQEIKQIHLPHLPNGIYLLRLSGDQVYHTEKIMVTK